jgi:hypothetical protein
MQLLRGRTTGITEHEELTQRKSKRLIECFGACHGSSYVIVLGRPNTQIASKFMPNCRNPINPTQNGSSGRGSKFVFIAITKLAHHNTTDEIATTAMAIAQ